MAETDPNVEGFPECVHLREHTSENRAGIAFHRSWTPAYGNRPEDLARRYIPEARLTAALARVEALTEENDVLRDALDDKLGRPHGEWLVRMQGAEGEAARLNWEASKLRARVEALEAALRECVEAMMELPWRGLEGTRATVACLVARRVLTPAEETSHDV